MPVPRPPSTPLGRPRLMGVLNVTPDSFSDGGRFTDVDSAIAHGRRLADEGADLLDVGGESTRPGATRPLLSEELDRVVPVISALSDAGMVVSVDTMRAEVARAAVAAGATVINDVSGGLADPDILTVAAEAGTTYVAMHWRGHSERMQGRARYDEPGGVVEAVCRELGERVEAIVAAGVAPERVVLDPGLGFAKRGAHNWELLRGLERLESLGQPILVGASRKKFLGELLARDGAPRPVDEREWAGAALTLMLAQRAVWGVRVHDVRASHDVLAVWQEMTQAP